MSFKEKIISQMILSNESIVHSEVPVPTNKVLLIDLDGTLIDGSYNITSANIYPAVLNLQRKGWLIGLSSDTPLEPLRTWRESFGMNGDIVAERGSIIEVEGRVYDNHLDVDLFYKSLQQMKSRFNEMGCRIWSGNTVEFLRADNPLGNPGEVVVLINTYRTQSIGLYVRRVGPSGKLEIDIDLTNQTIDAVRPLFPQIEDLNEDLNHDYGILILSRKAVIKRLGTLEVMSHRNLTQIGMIGNSMTDFVGSDIAIHYAVANAHSEFKHQADFVSSAEYTEGVVHILEELCNSRM